MFIPINCAVDTVELRNEKKTTEKKNKTTTTNKQNQNESISHSDREKKKVKNHLNTKRGDNDHRA